MGCEVLGRYLAFITDQRAALNGLLVWSLSRTEKWLAADAPSVVYLRLKAEPAQRLREDGVCSARVEVKLEQ